MRSKKEWVIGALVLVLTVWVLFLSVEDFRAEDYPAPLVPPPMPGE